MPVRSPSRVIFATSLRHDPEKSFHFAVEVAAGMAAELTVLYVLEQDHMEDGIYAEAVSVIDEMLKGAKEKNLVSRIRIRYGEPAEEIVSECSALGPELLILGAVPASPMAANFRTGVVYRVIAQAPCPTFTLRTETKAKQRQNGCASSAMHTVL
jgi:nucleotide-binding universal stress UspA family protein